MTTKGYYLSPLPYLIEAVDKATPDQLLKAIQALSEHLETYYYHDCEECEGRGTWQPPGDNDPQNELGCKHCDELGIIFEPNR